MVVCGVGSRCTDQLSQPTVCCNGCHTHFHLHCLGISRQASLHYSELALILKCICNKCEDATLLDVVRAFYHVSSKLDSQLEIIRAMKMSMTDIQARIAVSFTSIDEISTSQASFLTKLNETHEMAKETRRTASATKEETMTASSELLKSLLHLNEKFQKISTEQSRKLEDATTRTLIS